MYRGEDISKKTYGNFYVVKKCQGNRLKCRGTYWLCRCICGNEIIKRTDEILNFRNKYCKKCKAFNQLNGYKDISGSYWCNIKKQAKYRNIEFNIDIEYAWQLFIDQNKKCAFTGIDLILIKEYPKNKILQTASIDRKDSRIGYIKDNIQWVHKDINFMKQDLSDEKFLEYCKFVYLWRFK